MFWRCASLVTQSKSGVSCLDLFSLESKCRRLRIVSKGHAIVEFDAIVVADGERSVAEITHVAIWRPRQVAEVSHGAASPSEQTTATN